ncbi:MAG: hypothetical protein ACP5H7_00765 [Minisyncoccia bacterium]
MAKNIENITLIPREPKKPSIFVNILLIFSFLIFIFLGVGYFLLNKKIKDLNNENSTLENEIIFLNSPQVIEKRNNFLKLNSIIKNFSKNLHFKNVPSKVLKFIASNTLSEVVFNNFRFDATQKNVSLDGKVDSLQTLAEQILILQLQKEVSNVKVSNVSYEKEGNLTFSLTFNLSEDIFK